MRPTRRPWRWRTMRRHSSGILATDGLRQHPAVFDAAIRLVRGHGAEVEVTFLEHQLRKFGTTWFGAKVEPIVNDLQELRAHVMGQGA